MKPIRLEMEAFGSYGKRTTIDFTRPNQNLFLIAGDTGAGKSTIFDAIVFALYGKASSIENEKKGELLRSQYVELSVEPFVKLEFSEGEATYIVKRIPAYRRLQTRGAGKGVDLKEKAEAEKVSLIMPNGQEYIASVKETDKKIEEIVGLTKEQFMQVAMLAQGEFMKLLRDASDDKKAIFRKLFHTELFKKLVSELEKRKAEKGRALESIRAECRVAAAGVTVPKDYEDEEGLGELKQQITNGILANMEPFMEGLAGLCKNLAEEQDRRKAAYHKAEAKKEEQNTACTRAEALVKYFEQLADANKALAECERTSGEIKEMEALIQAIRAAYDIQIKFQQYEASKKTKETIEENIKNKRAMLPTLVEAGNKADVMEKKVKSELEAEQSALSKAAERVSAAKKTFEKISMAERELNKNASALEKAKRAEDSERKALEALKEKEIKWEKRAAELGNAEAAYAVWEGRSAEAERIGKEVDALKNIKSELLEYDMNMQKAQERFAKAKSAYEAKNDEYQSLNKRYMASRAKYFVDRLEDGKPCPICGATKHPAPCRLEADTEDISKALLEEVKDEAEGLNQKQSDAAKQSGAAVTAFEEKKKAFQESLAMLRESMQKHIDTAGQEITDENAERIFMQWKDAVKKEGKELAENVKELQNINTSLANTKEEKNQLEEKIDASHKMVEEASVSVKGSESEIRSLKEGLEYESEEAAEKEYQMAKKRCGIKEKEYQEASQKAAKAAKDKTQTETSISQYESELPNQLADMVEKKEAYEAIMQEKDLSEAEWRELVERHRKDKPQELQKKVNEYGKKKAAAESLKKAAEKEVEGKERPDVEALEKERESAQQAYNNARESFDAVKELYKDNQKAYDKLKPRSKECADAASEYNRLERLYKLFSGNVSGGRMDIETYVQRYYLKKILYAANRRFQEMSAGQFELRMIDLDKAGEGRSNKGLDLMVYSTVTGKTREVRTLSGGESFMAALALSLGMADQIQQSAASVNLDIMFIDEGFGSLDEHSRNQAVRVLKEMAGGSRLVGIISHVTELKQEIDNQLLVRRDEGGSHVEWQTN